MKENSLYTYKYPHPSVTTDCVVFRHEGNNLNILLVERGGEPYKGFWALPGGFMEIDETAEECVKRELLEETHLNLSKASIFEQLHTFSRVDRDPRERILSVAFIALVDSSFSDIKADDDAKEARWFRYEELPPLAFDHKDIIELAKERLKEKINTNSKTNIVK